MKIGFFFNHDQVHQVAHSLPIALALMRIAPEVGVVIATTNDRLTAEVRRLAAKSGVAVPLVQLGLTRRASRVAARWLEAVVPVSKLAVYRDNLDFFRGLDMLVVAEKTSLLLKTRYGLDALRIVHTRHGAGDRAIGFDKASAGFDQILVSGPKIAERLIHEAGIPADKLATVGYPKFDLVGQTGAPALFADPSKPVVLYNPHPSPHLSSWYRHGRQVLDFFLRDGRYNLIFAPHVMLFHRRFVLTIDWLRIDRPGIVEDRFRDAPNIHVDLGSNASTDMTYTMMADLYLGDVSSQIYEFLYRPRPALFLNSHGVDHADDPNYLHWRAGEVIANPDDLGAALDRALAQHESYCPVQRELFQRSFDLTDEPSADRAARAILGTLAPPSLPAAAA
ncbi:hypothetical protein [Sphingomonas nostoxanthinifaciens]|uniref:hypothetical protein n=1 Tax=Sphingomonas nostoxanthinifaciens TaxID=2872652 RepID=UPI001CC1C308|nr:hypothetical protein [Sphingomonas nostoxanthinifaciens]UAK23004.1 hypothetical protein K8P63_11230 [Sphingomonas nostoxanthinifaciens]